MKHKEPKGKKMFKEGTVNGVKCRKEVKLEIACEQNCGFKIGISGFKGRDYKELWSQKPDFS